MSCRAAEHSVALSRATQLWVESQMGEADKSSSLLAGGAQLHPGGGDRGLPTCCWVISPWLVSSLARLVETLIPVCTSASALFLCTWVSSWHRCWGGEQLRFGMLMRAHCWRRLGSYLFHFYIIKAFFIQGHETMERSRSGSFSKVRSAVSR